MPIVQWTDSLALGLQPIDQHHQHLVGLLNKAYDEFATKSATGMGDVLEALADYATYHFAEEEQLMNDASYPERERHLGEHAQFIARIGNIQREYNSGLKPISLEMITFLKDWLIEHISVVDARFGRFVIAKSAAR